MSDMMMLPLEMPPDGEPASGSAPLVSLRPYQSAALDAIDSKHRAGVTRQLAVLPTGTGKTVCFAHLIHRRAGRALVLAHRDELIQQAVDKLTMVTGNPLGIGIVKAKQNDTGAQVVVGSVQTLQRPGRVEQLGWFDTVIVDEAHHSVAATYLDILTRLGCMDDGGPLTVGWTATAQRTDKIGLGNVWQEITVRRGILQMIAEGYLVDVRGQQIGSDFDLANLRTKAGDYTDGSIGDELERSDALRAVVRAYRQYAYDDANPHGRLAVGFTPTIATAHALAAEFTAAGIPAEAVDGTMRTEDRRAVLARLHAGETRVVANCAVLTEGWDEPAVSCALMCRPTKSPPFFTQMVGRVLRPFTGRVAGERYEKTDALVLDVAGAADLGLATLATLAGLKPGSVKPGDSLLDAAEQLGEEERRAVAIGAIRTRQVDLLRRSERHWLDVGDSWVLPVGGGDVMILVPAAGPLDDAWEVWRTAKGGQPARESAATLTLDWARGVGEEIARTEVRADGGDLSRSDAAWRKRRASDAQLAQLERARIEIPKGLTRGAASDLLTAKYAGRDIARIRRLTAR
jgi:superfamily II DNA or RNA helicase